MSLIALTMLLIEKDWNSQSGTTLLGMVMLNKELKSGSHEPVKRGAVNPGGRAMLPSSWGNKKTGNRALAKDSLHA
jgi:hypothetical protein